MQSSTFWTAVGSIAAVFGVIIGIFQILKHRTIPKDKEYEEEQQCQFGRKEIPGSNICYEVVSTLKPLEGYKFVFCYGSLLIPESLIETLMRTKEDIEYLPATLRGYRLGWGAPSFRFNLVDSNFLSLGKKRKWLSLVAMPHNNSQINGAIIRVSEFEFSELSIREANYLPKKMQNYDFINQGQNLPQSDIYFFKPIQNFADLNEIESNNTDLAIRQEYADGIKQMLKELGFPQGLPHYPTNTIVINAFNPDTLFAKAIRKSGLSLVDFYDSLNRSLREYTHINGVEYEIPTEVRPMIISGELFLNIKKTAEASVSLCSKALDGLLSDKDLLKRSKYRDSDIDGALAKFRQNGSSPTIARVDMTFFKEKVHVFEVNGDSPGGMFHIDFLKEQYNRFFSDRQGLPTNIGFLECKNTCEAISHAIQDICIVPGVTNKCLNTAMLEVTPELWNTYPEFRYFESVISNENINFFLCEPKDIEADISKSGQLFCKGKLIDVIYKRALIKDLEIEKNIQQFELIKNSIINGDICCINSLRSRLSGSKFLLAMIKDKTFQEKYLTDLSENERAVLNNNMPEAILWDEKLLKSKQERIMKNINKYVLKSFDGFGGGEVFHGDSTAKMRQQFLEAIVDQYKGFIVQEKMPHGRTLMPIVRHGKVQWRYFYYIFGAYVINGKCIAIEAKCSDTQKVNLKSGFRTVVFPVDI